MAFLLLHNYTDFITSFSIKSLSKLLVIYTATENKKFDRKTIKVNQK